MEKNLIVFAAICLACALMINACPPAPPPPPPPGSKPAAAPAEQEEVEFTDKTGKEVVIFRPVYEKGLEDCLKEKNVSEKDTRDLGVSDLQCRAKYMWSSPGASFSIYGKNNGAYNDYNFVYGFLEPKQNKTIKIDIDASCQVSGGNGTQGFSLAQWYCLEYCEWACSRYTPSDGSLPQHPVKKISCKVVGDKTGCQETRKCACVDRKDKACPNTDITFDHMLTRYKEQCLNCKNKRFVNKEQPWNVCINNSVHARGPKLQFDAIRSEWKPLEEKRNKF